MPESKQVAQDAVEGALEDLVRLSHEIHDRPETAFEEVRSAALACETLAGAGFSVTTGTAGMPTAFSAEIGDGSLVLAICAEYDALPKIGHACGHNIIAASAVGAGLGLAPLADELGLTVRVLGTPAEEGGGGKVVMLDAGAFEDVHAAMMIHPWPEDHLEATCLAVSHFDVIFTGRTAHASAAPWHGINAGDAMVIAQVALGLLRQQLLTAIRSTAWSPPAARPPTSSRPGSSAGSWPAPGHSRGSATSSHGFGPASRPAQATGAEVRFEALAPDYSHMVSDPALLAPTGLNAERLGRTFDADDAGSAPPTISTDMANVSLSVPTIHPLLGIDSGGAVNHQPEFAAACVTPSADLALRDGAVAMAWTAIDAATGPLRDRLLAG